MSRFIGPGNKVPFVSQIDDVPDPQWQRKFCGIVSVYMVLAYWWNQRAIPHYPGLETVSKYGLDIDGYSDTTGWIHAKLAEVARHYHHEAVSRSWMVRHGDLSIIQNQGRAAARNEIARYKQQVQREFVATLRDELTDGVPVILSVKAKFGNNGGNHLVVITGIAEDGSAVTIHDPEEHRSAANREVPMSYLLEYSNFNAIFIYG